MLDGVVLDDGLQSTRHDLHPLITDTNLLFTNSVLTCGSDPQNLRPCLCQSRVAGLTGVEFGHVWDEPCECPITPYKSKQNNSSAVAINTASELIMHMTVRPCVYFGICMGPSCSQKMHHTN